MKGKQTALMPGNGDKVGYWLTPPEVYGPLLNEFRFDFDPCPYPRPSGFDGLREEWGSSNWVNPPFEGPRKGFAAWARKAIRENRKGKTVVLILPLDNWVRLLIEAGAELRSLGQTDWTTPEGKRRKSSRPNFLFILR